MLTLLYKPKDFFVATVTSGSSLGCNVCFYTWVLFFQAKVVWWSVVWWSGACNRQTVVFSSSDVHSPRKNVSKPWINYRIPKAPRAWNNPKKHNLKLDFCKAALWPYVKLNDLLLEWTLPKMVLCNAVTSGINHMTGAAATLILWSGKLREIWRILD